MGPALVWRLIIQQKFASSLIGILMLMAVMLLVELAMGDIQTSVTETLVDRLVPERDESHRLRATIAAADDDGAWYLLGGARDVGGLQRYRTHLQEADASLVTLEHLAMDTAERDILRRLRSAWSVYTTGNARAFSLAAVGQIEGAQRAYLRVPVDASLRALTALDAEVTNRIDEAYRKRARAHAVARVVGILFAIATLGLAIIVALGLSRSLAKVRFLQSHDEDTGLPNSRFAHAFLEQALHARANPGSFVAVVYLRLQGFTTHEDSGGSVATDELIRLSAERLKRVLPQEHVLARASSDVLAIILEHAPTREYAERVVRVCLADLSEPFAFNGSEVVAKTRAGLSLYPGDGSNAAELLRNADTALDSAAAAHAPYYAAFSPLMRQRSLQRLTLERDLQRALLLEQMELYYQPIVDVTDMRITGFEALLRWHHPTLGTLEPATFLESIEHAGLTESIGAWVLRTACEQCKVWQDAGRMVTVSVNVSPTLFRACDLEEMVRRILNEVHLTSASLELELIETSILENGTRETLLALTDLGVSVAIDDFGTGYSSLSYLRYFPADTLKIDRSFVTDITRRPYDRAIVGAIIHLGQLLGLRIIAEGVENTAQRDELQRLGCTLMQGYHYGIPVPARECFEMELRS